MSVLTHNVIIGAIESGKIEIDPFSKPVSRFNRFTGLVANNFRVSIIIARIMMLMKIAILMKSPSLYLSLMTIH